MAKLRKMLGSTQHPTVIALMRLIETQSHTTLIRWAVASVKERCLPLVSDPRMTEAVAAAESVLTGAPLKVVKPALRAATAAAREADDPVSQAAARAISTACAVVQTPTNALGFTFYAAAAAAYHQAGLEAAPAEYDALGDAAFAALYQSLQAAAVPDEPHPVKVDWGC